MFFKKKDIRGYYAGKITGRIKYPLKNPIIGIILAGFIFFSLSLSQARTIWKIGFDDETPTEFFRVPTSDQIIVTYQVPEDWHLGPNLDWTSFPYYLYPQGSSLHPEEILINFAYLHNYRDPIVRLKASSYRSNYTQKLIVLKGEDEDLIGEAPLISSYTLFEFPLGPIQKGSHEKNEIIIKNQSISEEYNRPISFDYIELDDQDHDGDGSLDSEEFEGNTDKSDNDDLEDKLDPDTASILIKSYDQSVTKRIILDIEEKEYPCPYFQEITLLDQNSPLFSPEPPSDIFFPYGLFSVKIQMPDEEEEIPLRIIYPEKLYPLVQFYLYHESKGWQELPKKISSENSLTISLKAENDWYEREERETSANDITIIGGLAYPREMEATLKKNGCFISIVSFSALNEWIILFFGFLLVLFLFHWCMGKRFSTEEDLNYTTNKTNSFNLFPAKRYTLILILVFLLLFTATSPLAFTFPDMKMSATPNPVGSGARALGIGGAFIAIADDATAASWNPGALLRLKKSEISIVGSCFSGKNTYHTSIINEEAEIDDLAHDQKHLNYLSAVFPFSLFQRNMVFSLNYQHLYEFYRDTSYKYRYTYEDPDLGDIVNIPMMAHKRQKGALNTFSPALAIQIIPALHIGLTTNFWLDEELNNCWENINTVQSDGEGWSPFGKIKTYKKIYERYNFAGFNMHIGFLWQANRWFTLGGILKTPFKADIKHEYQSVSIIEYPQNLARSSYTHVHHVETLTLKIPASYGLGASIRFSDNYLMALDIYRTQWEDYILSDHNGEKISPINNKFEHEADIKPTIQVRLGAEYTIIGKRWLIPIRTGIFYDPEPDGGRVDDFYGASIGTGIAFKNVAFDIAYQYRFGHKKRGEFMQGKEISSDIKQHYLHTSMILYF